MKTDYTRIEDIKDCNDKTIKGTYEGSSTIIGLRFDIDKTYYFAKIDQSGDIFSLDSQTPTASEAYKLGIISQEELNRSETEQEKEQKEQEYRLFLSLRGKFNEST